MPSIHHDMNSTAVQDNLKLLLQEYELQFAKDETTIGTTPLTSMTIDTGSADPFSQKSLPYSYETLSVSKGRN